MTCAKCWRGAKPSSTNPHTESRPMAKRPSWILKTLASDLGKLLNSGNVLLVLLALGFVQLILPPLFPIIVLALIAIGGLYLALYLFLVVREFIEG